MTDSSSDPSTRSAGRSAGAKVREARPADCGAIAAIYNEAIRSRRATMDTLPVAAAHFEDTLAGLSPRELLLVADGSADVVGWGAVKQYSDRPGYAVACETSVYVTEAAQGQGAGTQLLEALVARAAKLGYRHLVAKIMGVNERSIAFHAERGFELVGRQRKIGRLDGVFHDVVILERLLPDPPSDSSKE